LKIVEYLGGNGIFRGSHKDYKMLETIFDSKNRERVLQFILDNGEGYAKEIADF